MRLSVLPHRFTRLLQAIPSEQSNRADIVPPRRLDSNQHSYPYRFQFPKWMTGKAPQNSTDAIHRLSRIPEDTKIPKGASINDRTPQRPPLCFHHPPPLQQPVKQRYPIAAGPGTADTADRRQADMKPVDPDSRRCRPRTKVDASALDSRIPGHWAERAKAGAGLVATSSMDLRAVAAAMAGSISRRMMASAAAVGAAGLAHTVVTAVAGPVGLAASIHHMALVAALRAE
jgi:hypothetical protein